MMFCRFLLNTFLARRISVTCFEYAKYLSCWSLTGKHLVSIYHPRTILVSSCCPSAIHFLNKRIYSWRARRLMARRMVLTIRLELLRMCRHTPMISSTYESNHPYLGIGIETSLRMVICLGAGPHLVLGCWVVL